MSWSVSGKEALFTTLGALQQAQKRPFKRMKLLIFWRTQELPDWSLGEKIRKEILSF